MIVRYKGEARRQWPVGLVEELFPSADELVRKVHVRLVVNGNSCTYMRPINELNMRPIRELHLSNWVNVYYWTFTSICSVNDDIVMNKWIRHKGIITIIMIIFFHMYILRLAFTGHCTIWYLLKIDYMYLFFKMYYFCLVLLQLLI